MYSEYVLLSEKKLEPLDVKELRVKDIVRIDVKPRVYGRPCQDVLVWRGLRLLLDSSS